MLHPTALMLGGFQTDDPLPVRGPLASFNGAAVAAGSWRRQSKLDSCQAFAYISNASVRTSTHQEVACGQPGHGS